MLHEALCYLWNCPGDFFKFDTEEDWLSVAELQEFLHPGEQTLFQRISAIAISYHRIEAFIKSVNDNVTNESSCVRPGLYIKAFCNGLDAVLDEYRDEILHLEETLMKNPQLTLTYVVGSVEKYGVLFEALKSMIKLITNEEVHGCLLIAKLHSYVDCGVNAISQAANKLMRAINVMFYRHLCNWIIYGHLNDAYSEFFICDANSFDENFSYLQKSVTNSESFSDSFLKRKVKKCYPVRKFYLNEEMVPSVISSETAETILFLGRIVWIMRNDPKQESDDKFQITYKRDIWEGKENDYYRKLESLENQPLNLVQFDKVIEDCRLCITKYLWKTMVEEANLLEHLQLIRDYYALGRGELFQQFITVTNKHQEEIRNDYLVTNLNFIFTECARKMYGDNDKTYLRFELVFPKNVDVNTDANLWANFELNFDVQWPLHIIFHPKALNLYNKLFTFLLRVKKTHIDLHKLWLYHKEKKPKIDPSVIFLRTSLMFIVNNLQYYLQVDVIEANFSVFKSAIKNANQFEDIIRLHSTFLFDLMNKTFVMSSDKAPDRDTKHTLYQLIPTNYVENSMVYKIILEILQLCDQFCFAATTWSNPLTKPELQQLNEFEKRSDNLIDVLLRVLYSLHKKASGHHLLQLVHHIDFNRWFSRNKVELNLTVS